MEIEEREGKFSYISWMVLSYEFDPRYISMGNGKFWKVSWRETLLNIMYRDRKIEKLEKIKYRLREIFCRFCRELKTKFDQRSIASVRMVCERFRNRFIWIQFVFLLIIY